MAHKSKYPGFVLITLSQVKARISHGWSLKVYYCCSNQSPAEKDNFFYTDGFPNLAVFERRLLIYKEQCNEEEGKTLKFYYKE